MKQIRKRPRLDILLNQQRGPSSPWGRRIYLGLLGALVLGICDYLIGDAFILRADGILMADRRAVDAAFPARVAAVYVREGDSVQAGALLMKLESFDMQREIAELAARNVELGIREAQLRVDQSRVSALLPLADRWSHGTTLSVDRLDTITSKGLISSQTQNQALSARYDAAAKLSELQGQSEVLQSEIPEIQQSRSRAETALSELERLYDNGSVRAPDAGVIGPHVPVVGHVAKTGDQLMLIYGGAPYVLAYLPSLYFFAVSRGDQVEVNGGPGSPSVAGVVDSVLDVADSLPEEFQNTSRPRERSRLMRIALPEAHGFAHSQKVTISGCAFGWCWRSAAFADLSGGTGSSQNHPKILR